MNILLVKLSSLGDVLHNLPVVWDLRVRFPDANIDWVVEEAYVHLLEPMRHAGRGRGLDNIIPLALRRWRRDLRAGHFRETGAAFAQFRAKLQQREYQVVIETQGLIKSAVVARLARRVAGGVVAGLANRTEFSGYEPLARFFYDKQVAVDPRCHAVDRSRQVAAAAVGAPALQRDRNPPAFYPQAQVERWRREGLMAQPYAICFHATARDAKRWAEEHWIALGRHLCAQGVTPVLPWGSTAEKQISERLAAAIPGAMVPEAFAIERAFGIVAGARVVIGVDTGLTHLAAILGTPTVEIYCDSPRWKTEGYWGPAIRNLGDRGAPPAPEAVIEALSHLL